MIIAALVVAVAVAVGVAFYKHHTLAAVEASAKKEFVNLEAVFAKAEATVKTSGTAIVNRLKALF